MKKRCLLLLLATSWIGFSEFLRNEFFFKSLWLIHYENLGLRFETSILNGILWFVWSFFLATILFYLLQKFSLIKTIILSWISSFLMMWITAYNLQVLPLKLLVFAIPLSVLELVVAALLLKKVLD